VLTESRQKGAIVIRKWNMPPVGWVKCNVDGAFDADQGQGATRVVLRDHTGTYKGGRAHWHQHGLNALSMEAEACRDGMILAGELNVRRLLVETDNQELLKLWEMGESQRSCISPIIREIRELSTSFVDFSLVYANRDCNRVAHTLAKQVSDSIRVGVWQLAPSCIADLLTEDCNRVIS
jgi:ribonuclease HI